MQHILLTCLPPTVVCLPRWGRGTDSEVGAADGTADTARLRACCLCFRALSHINGPASMVPHQSLRMRARHEATTASARLEVTARPGVTPRSSSDASVTHTRVIAWRFIELSIVDHTQRTARVASITFREMCRKCDAIIKRKNFRCNYYVKS